MRLTKLFRSSTFRLALIHTTLFGVSALLLLAFIYQMTVGYLQQQLQTVIEHDIEQLLRVYRQAGIAGLTTAVNERARQDRSGYTIYALILVDSARPEAGNLKRWPRRALDNGWISFDLDAYMARGYGDTGDAWAKVQILTPNERLLVGRNTEDLDEQRAVITQALGWGLAVTVLLGLLSGIALSFGTLRRLDAIKSTSQAVMRGDLSQRIPVTDANDDLSQVAMSLNNMLDRIQCLMDNVKQVSNDIAHDLRTPLTRLRGKLEGVQDLLSDDSPSHAAMLSALQDVDEMLTTFNAMLRIALVESGSVASAFDAVDLAVLTADAVDLYEPLAAEKAQSLRIECDAAVRVWGDRSLIFQTLVNLLDNAIKYTPPGGNISVHVAAHPQGGRIVIADSGPGIAAADRDRVLQRFVRLQPERTSKGSGLGLSLVAAIVKLHRGQLDLSDNRPGLRVTLTLLNVAAEQR